MIPINHRIVMNSLLTDGFEADKVDKFLRPVQMGPRTLREARELITGVLEKIPASSLGMVEVLEDWRVGNVACKDKTRNYIPVSLPSVARKLLDAIQRDLIIYICKG